MEPQDPITAREAPRQAGQPLKPPEENDPGETKREPDSAPRLAHGATGDDLAAADEPALQGSPDDSDASPPESSDESLEGAEPDAPVPDESATPSEPIDDGGASFAEQPAEDGSDGPIDNGLESGSSGISSADEASTASGEDSESPGELSGEADSAGETARASDEDRTEITTQPLQRPAKAALASSPAEQADDGKAGAKPAPRVNYLPIPLSVQDAAGMGPGATSTPRLVFDVTVEGAAMIAEAAVQRVAARIDKLIDERIDTKINDREWLRACQMRAVLGP
jgi:hypothetical protein